ncbi:Outer membrane protein assembly factor YaeT precursor [hydrothermal vent metagenome]|uniref:Outer membrane protein assembly factor YaeT n=1 Tax=hydrothermal vent metagenome TaxID=652676 RepID=A0A1W1BSU9_9ZZZZ
MKKIITLSIITSSLVLAGAYKVPEQSLNSMALGATYVAHTTGADTAYFNPANMAFLEDDKQFMEVGLTWAHLPSNKFEGQQAFSATEVYGANGGSLCEDLQLPFIHFVSKPLDNGLRWGASLTVPGGLTKRWETPYQKLSAEEFTLKVVEINPVISYKAMDNLSIGGGLRVIYSEGVVKSDGSGTAKPIKREMEGDTIEYGYNLAMTYKPIPSINIATTYRSNIDLDEDGEANLYMGDMGHQYSTDVSVPLPAALNLAVSKTWSDRYTLEFNYERTYWSEYEDLDFNYGSAIQPASLVPIFDKPKTKNWEDTNTYRVGATIDFDNITLMMAYSKDESPIPKKYLSYELPDADANIYSVGLRFDTTKNLSWGFAYLHDDKESVTLNAGENKNGIIGKFSGGGAQLFTAGLSYKF